MIKTISVQKFLDELIFIQTLIDLTPKSKDDYDMKTYYEVQLMMVNEYLNRRIRTLFHSSDDEMVIKPNKVTIKPFSRETCDDFDEHEGSLK